MALNRGITVCRILRTAQQSPVTGLIPMQRGGPQAGLYVHARCSSTSITEVRGSSGELLPQSLRCGASQQTAASFDAPSSSCRTVSPSVVDSRLSPVNITEYQCPTRLLERLTQLVILDKTPSQNLSYECPVSSPVTSSIAPDLEKSEILEPGSKPVAMEAKMIMRIRHKKMKKHKLRKLRKRMYFLWKKQKATRKARRMVIYNKELEDIKATGEQFNAEEFVRSQLDKARRGGYYINVLNTKH